MSEINPSVPTSAFRCAIANPKRYMKANTKDLPEVGKAAYEGDLETLEILLATGDENNLFNGDLNTHITSYTALQMAAKAGQTECVELLIRAKADPHVKECVAYGTDPMDGKSALDLAKEYGWDDTAELLEGAEKAYPYGFYVPTGPSNNAKVYNCWEHGKKPAKDWFMGRPGAAKAQGLDPKKYGYAEEKEPEIDLEEIAAPALAGGAPAEKPLPIGLLFPGQGSQYVKMMSTLKDIPAVADMLAKAKTILGFDVLDLCLNGPEEKLELTANCQPCMFIASLAGIEKLRGDREEAVTRCQVLAGLSLGEYTALCVAGVFTFEDGLKLVKLRGECMQKAASASPQLMLSVAGLDKPKLQELCAEAKGSGVCQIANELFPKGFSCAGTEASINKLKELADKAGALQAKVLKTSGGFHTSLMAPAAETLGKALDDLLPSMKPPRTTVYMNATAEPVLPGTSPKVIVKLMKDQLTNPVLWEPSVRGMIKEGVSEFYEVGPMKQIKAMMKRIDSKMWGSTINVEV
jgi:[acyl-carrier-protein] S-malonyltransferase